MQSSFPPSRHSWFGTLPPPEAVQGSVPAEKGGQQHSGFARLWTNFMSARALLAVALLLMHGMAAWVGRGSAQQHTLATMLWLCAAYALVTVGARVFGRAYDDNGQPDRFWLLGLALDVLFFVCMQAQTAAVSYTPMLVLPVLMAALLGSRLIALGAAACASLAVIGLALWTLLHSARGDTHQLVQAGLTGAALLLLALLANQIALRLAREEGVARRSRIEAQVQSMVNDMVVNALPDGVLVVDAAGAVRTANPAARMMLGSDDEVTPHRFSLNDDSAWTPLAHLAQKTFHSGALDECEVTLHHEAQSSSHLKVRTQRTPTIGGASLCVMFLQDQREMEARLRTEKLAAMGRMSAAVAHEIRNPLAAITQANALLAEELDETELAPLTGMVRQNAQRLGRIVDDVLDVARVQGGDGGVEAIALDEYAGAFCAEWAGQHGCGERLRVQLQAEGVYVQFAPEHLRRVLVNLLDNAARYATHGAAALQVATHTVRHGAATLLVWSDGAPLDAGVQRHLFEPFFSSESRSSGLGLFLCRELCERHGAAISYERTNREQEGRSIEGNGFFISFRRMPAPSMAPDTQIQERQE